MSDRRGIARPDMSRQGSSPLGDRADRRRQLVAFGTISGLVLVAFGLWLVAILTSSDPRQLEIAAEPPAVEEAPPTDEPDEPDEQGDDSEAADDEIDLTDRAGAADDDSDQNDATEPANDDSDPIDWADVADDDSDQNDATEPANDEGDRTDEADVADDEGDQAGGSGDGDLQARPDSGDTDDTDDTGDTEVGSVTIDGVCTVELGETERDASALRAWEFADCAYAPVPVDDQGERWIVVRASMSAGAADAQAAEQRARDLGVDGGVLWSSHYPSLNPDFWVVYEGPFPDAEAARNAADAADGEAYARALRAD